MGLAGNRKGHWVLSGQGQGPAKGHPAIQRWEPAASFPMLLGSLGCLKTKSVPVLDIPSDQQLGPRAACHRVSRHLDSLFCLGPLEKVVTGQREGRPFTITPPLAPPHSCLAFIWQNGAYQSHQLNKHTNPRLVRKNTLPELFISCSQALHTAHCQKHRREPEAKQWGPSSPLWRWRVAFPSLALSCLPFRLSHLPSSLLVPSSSTLFSGRPCQWVSYGPHRTPSSVCFLTGDNGPAGGLWNGGGTGMIRAHTRQAGATSSLILPGPPWTPSPCPPPPPSLLWPCVLGASLASAPPVWPPWKQRLQLQSPL